MHNKISIMMTYIDLLLPALFTVSNHTIANLLYLSPLTCHWIWSLFTVISPNTNDPTYQKKFTVL